MVGRVEWAALEGSEAETVLANLLYNKYGRALRVRPAQGDYGIDVIVPATEAAEPWDIYQIKKFATNLTENQKKQIDKSFSRLLFGMVRRGFKINNWYLVMPLDPTPDNLDWFSKIADRAINILKSDEKDPLTDTEEHVIREWLTADGRHIEWKGLIFCEPLAAEFPYVTDHYLHGGAERLRSAVDSVAGLLGGEMRARIASEAAAGNGSTALLEPGEMLDHIALLDSVLDTDPHYTYEHSVGPNPPKLQPETNLIAAKQQKLPNNRWLTFKVYQRSAQSLEERPIPFSLEFTFEEGSPKLEELRNWQKYGKPFQATASYAIDLPGGLGGSGDCATVSVPPPAVTNSDPRMRIIDPQGKVLAELRFDLESTFGQEAKGTWTSGTDTTGILEYESYYDSNPEATQQLNFSLPALAGLVAADAQPAVRFARNLVWPNSLQIARSVGPFSTIVIFEEAEALVPPAVDRIVTELSVLQKKTTHLLQIPDFSKLKTDVVREIHRAADLIEGGTRVGTWTHITIEEPVSSMKQGDHFQLALYKPLLITLDGIELNLGIVEQILLSASVESVVEDSIRVVPNLSDAVYERLTEEIPDGGPEYRIPVRGRRYPESQEES